MINKYIITALGILFPLVGYGEPNQSRDEQRMATAASADIFNKASLNTVHKVGELADGREVSYTLIKQVDEETGQVLNHYVYLIDTVKSDNYREQEGKYHKDRVNIIMDKIKVID